MVEGRPYLERDMRATLQAQCPDMNEAQQADQWALVVALGLDGDYPPSPETARRLRMTRVLR